ncbi:ATP-dependent helicase [Thermohalobacter berrensis]|uniref:DNA 3'-5' helicase n=1 Tax=Thermohalobacter berrensis TaxID=99594 RepID=A0A419T6D7_9FIRM|nr:ATP-dependent helicase [Thermohalobacter berrensis]RKD32979.1 DNA helicase UvrD [Thermohalobacter berrensis]
MDNGFFYFLQKEKGISLNPQQKQAVLHKDGPAVVLAVPGAGKTTVLICRTANLVMNYNINPKNILSITFSKASAKDMKKRFYQVFGDFVRTKVEFSTIHRFAYSVLRHYYKKNKINWTLIESKDSDINKSNLLKELYRSINRSHINDDKLEELSNTISYVKNMMIEIDDFNKHKNFGIENFDRIFSQYEWYKRKYNYIDFDDMLTETLKILKKDNILLNQCKERYKYIQVDEGQDVSKVQNEIIKLLAYPLNNLFVVADDDQSIYGFRGAYPEYLLNFNRVYPNAKTFFMEENYRSSNNIVSVCNDFIKENTIRYEKNMFTKNNSIKPVTIVKLNDEYDQLDYIIDKLKKCNNLSEVAILYRNNISSISLIDRLHKENIPFYIKDLKLHFFKHWVVKDITNFLKLALDNSDINAFEKVYFKMNGYIPKRALNYIIENTNNGSVFERLLKYPDFKSFQKDNILRLESDFNSILKMKPQQAMEFIENNLEYRNFLKDNCKKFGFSYESGQMVLSTLKLLSVDTNSPIEFLSKLEGLKGFIDSIKNKKSQNALTLTTIHSAKGLEFDKVYMIDLIDGEFPTIGSIKDFDEGNISPLEEERRLFYVGMTRAKTILDLIVVNYKNGENVYPSRFINELEEILEKYNLENNISKFKYKSGTLVKHKKFGKGKIKSIEDNIITIDFHSKGIKKFALDLCVKNNILDIL